MQQLTVDKGIFELGSAPDAAFILLSVLVSLSVAVVFKGRPVVERVDILSALANLPGLLITRCLMPGENNLDGL